MADNLKCLYRQACKGANPAEIMVDSRLRAANGDYICCKACFDYLKKMLVEANSGDRNPNQAKWRRMGELTWTDLFTGLTIKEKEEAKDE